MAKSIFITDIHFSVRGGSLYFIERYKLFFKNIFFPYCDEHKVKNVYLLGDTWEDRKNMNINALREARQMFFDECLIRNINIISILGNHDVFYRNTNETNAMDIIESAYPNVKIIQEYEEIEIGSKTFGFMSWINSENYARNMKRIEESNTNYLLGHFEISQFEMTRGVIADKGMSHDLFKNYDMVLSGHFHIKNKIGNIYYIGNPFQTTWDDFGTQRGFHSYDHEKDEFEFVHNTYENYNAFIYDDSLSLENFNYKAYDGQMVKILVTRVSQLDHARYMKFLDEMSKHTHEFIVIETDEADENKKPEIIKLKSNTEMIADFVNALNINEDQKSSTIDILINLHKNAVMLRDTE